MTNRYLTILQYNLINCSIYKERVIITRRVNEFPNTIKLRIGKIMKNLDLILMW
jgi:hypothetical protein